MSDDRALLIGESANVHNENQYGSIDKVNNQEEPVVSVEVAKRAPQYIAAISATLSALAAGLVLGWTSPISVDVQNGKFNNITVDSNQMGWIGSSSTLGALSLSSATGILCDIVGRKLMLLLLIVPYGIGWSTIIWAKSLAALYIGRFITGMAVGGCCIAAPLYTSEIAQKEIRGKLGSYFQLMVTAGVLFAYFFGKFLDIMQFTLLCSAVPFFFVLVFLFQPETPIFYLKSQQYDKAKVSLGKLRGPNYNIEAELSAMQLSVTNASENTLSVFQLLRRRATVRALIVSFGLMFFQQFGGINAIIFYTSDIFTASKIKIDPKVASIIVGAFQVVATFISSLIVDRGGRRSLLIGSIFVMGISSLFLGLFFTLKDRQVMNEDWLIKIGFLPVVALCLFVIVFSLGVGPIPWMMPAEIFAPEIKGVATSAAGSFNWFLAFIITKFYLDLEVAIGTDIVFYIFTVISFIGTVFVIFIVPETKGKTVQEIQTLLEE